MAEEFEYYGHSRLAWGSFRLPVGDIDNLWLGSSIHLNDLKMSAIFVREL